MQQVSEDLSPKDFFFGSLSILDNLKKLSFPGHWQVTTRKLEVSTAMRNFKLKEGCLGGSEQMAVLKAIKSERRFVKLFYTKALTRSSSFSSSR
jgi:hypothetical protein